MSKPVRPVQDVTMTASPSAKAKINLTYTKSNGNTFAMKTATPPTEDMIDMASALADYLTSGRKPARWS